MQLVLAKDTDIQFAENLVIGNMGLYFREYGIEWDSDRFKQNWSKSDNYILKSGGTMVGFVSLVPDRDVTYIRDLQVVRSHQRQGFGSWLVRQVERNSLDRGLYRLRLRIFNSNSAIEFYQHIGFKIGIREDITVGMEKALINH